MKRTLTIVLGMLWAGVALGDVSLTDRGSMRHAWKQRGEARQLKSEEKAKLDRRSSRGGGLVAQPEGTGSASLVDSIGNEWFINTDITFATSSSMSAAVSEASFTASQNIETSAGGGTSFTSITDAFDGYEAGCVSLNGSTGPCPSADDANYSVYNQLGAAPTSELGGRQFVFPVKSVGGTLNVQRKLYVPTTDSFARWMTILTNTGAAPISVNYITSNNLGSDSNTFIRNSSSGDATVTTADLWATTDDNFVDGDPFLGHVFYGAGAPPVTMSAATFANTDDNPYWVHTVPLAVGETAIILNFATAQLNRAAAAAKAGEIANAVLGDEAFAGLTVTEQGQVVNFNLGALGVAPYPANPALGPATLADYESCDVVVRPAATLLLPYFEVDPSGLGENTLVTVTNASDTSIVAHVTVWSNWSFPVLDFNLFLTGYDVVSLSLRDLLVSGNIPNTARATAISPRGVRSTSGGTWIQAPYNATLTTTCATAQGGVGAVPGFLLAQIQSGLMGGPYSAGGVACGQVGDVSDNMVGYMTFDTSAVCSQSLPTDAPYFTTEIRWENQLIGDYIRLNDADGVAGGNPLVHIAALPGGDNTPTTTLEWTFYSRYQAGVGVADSRQPLPALFAGRYIEAGTAFDTDFVIWREGVTDEVDTVDCNGALALNASFPYVEFVRFDERENPTTRTGGCQVSPCPPNIGLSETQLVNVNNTSFIPGDPSADTGGWVYFNLSIPEGDLFSWGRPSQNWVQVRMTGASLYGVDFDAAYLGNGCQYHVGITLLDGGTGSSSSGEKIGPKYERGTLTGWIGN